MNSIPALTSATRLEAEAVGLMAGWGDYPVVVARSLKKQGYNGHSSGVSREISCRVLVSESKKTGLSEDGKHVS